MTLTGIVAMAENRVIGRDGELPWRLPADLRRFKRLTMGAPIVMGRKTFESIGRALPGRTSIVMTRRPDFTAPPAVLVARSLDEALRLAEASLRGSGKSEVFVIGGEQIYRAALRHLDRLYVTLVRADVDGDAFFPGLSPGEWRVTSEEEHPADARHPHACTFRVMERVREAAGGPRSGGADPATVEEPPGF